MGDPVVHVSNRIGQAGRRGQQQIGITEQAERGGVVLAAHRHLALQAHLGQRGVFHHHAGGA